MDARVGARLEALRRHLDGYQDPPLDAATRLSLTPVSAPLGLGERPAPGGGKGILTVKDNRTNNTYEIQVADLGFIHATDIAKARVCKQIVCETRPSPRSLTRRVDAQIKAGGDGFGLKLYDPGYMNTAPCRSAVSYIDGDKGVLRYRGYPIEELAEHSTFMEVSYLLLYGSLPSAKQLASFQEAVLRHSALPLGVSAAVKALPHDAHPMGALLVGLSALGAHHPEANPAMAGQGVYKAAVQRDKQCVRLLGKMPALAAAAYHLRTGRSPAAPRSDVTYAESFLYQLDAGLTPGHTPHPRLARALDVMFILHAEHEMNCSTAAARHLASSGVDVYTCVQGAVGALYGPLHGGANEAVLRMLARIGGPAEIPAFLDAVKARKEILFGFGHRVYKNFDPRAACIRRVAEEVFSLVGRDPLIDTATALEKAARADEYFISRKLYPNVDFYSGLVYRALGFPTNYFTVLFAVPRVAGYLAHWRESLDDGDAKIMRPQQIYIGEWLRSYTPVDRRADVDPYSAFGGAQPSAASRRRLAGVN